MSLIPIIIALAFIAFVAIYAVTKIKHCCLPKRRAKINVMKRAAALLIAFATLNATAATKDPTALYKAGEVQVDAIAFAEGIDAKNFEYGGGIGITYWHWKTVGAGFEGKTLDPRHALFDTIGLNLAARYPTKYVTPFTKIGFDWQAEQVHNDRANDFDVYVGIGAEKRFGHGFSVGAELRGVRAAELAPNEKLQILLRVGKAF